MPHDSPSSGITRTPRENEAIFRVMFRATIHHKQVLFDPAGFSANHGTVLIQSFTMRRTYRCAQHHHFAFALAHFSCVGWLGKSPLQVQYLSALLVVEVGIE
jgi:hypothetical protein